MIVRDVLFSERNLRKICLHIVLKMEFSKIILSHSMIIPTLLMLFESHLLSIKTSVKIPYECGDPLEDIFCHECTCELCGRGAHYGYNFPPKVPVVPDLEPFNNQIVDELAQTLPNLIQHVILKMGIHSLMIPHLILFMILLTIYQLIREKTCAEWLVEEQEANIDAHPFQPKVLSLAWETILEIELSFEDKHCQPEDILELFQRLHNDMQNIHEEFAVYINTLSWDRPTICYDDDEDYAIAVTPSLSTKDPDNSLSMWDEHLDTIPTTESKEFIKSSVENLVPTPSESEGIPDNMCDMPFHDNSPPLDVSKYQFEDFFDSNDESTSNDDDSFSIDNIEYVEASPLDSELVSSQVMEIVIPKVGGIDDDILLTIKEDIIRDKLLNIYLLIANIKVLNDNPTPSSDLMTKSSSTSLKSLLEETNTFDKYLPEFETFCFDLEEISSGSTTTRSDISLPEYEAFYDDHVKEISSVSTTTYSDSSLYDLFIFDLSINPFPLAIGVISMSSSMSSLTSYLHQSMIISASRLNPTRGISLWMRWRIFF
uniref:Uncharacterized protein n=1 Tax=Tanacetum cinerariifolium TaxID=118510 RepID=A0A699J3E7_TANCI|nr:hypothetical protein [Tanacetum cinerariifolium]